MFIARQSSHIQEDIARNWSSWNFGNDGFEGTEEELNEAIEEAKDGYFFGDGDCFDSDEWELVHSQGDIHIFKSL